jgi:alpha-L-glutamate ligase-like protein
MMLGEFRRLKELGVLSMNSRNADFIMEGNPRSLFPLVDDKVETKALAEKYQIPTPALYYLVEHQGSIKEVPQKMAGISEFAVKPARGSGGNGILLIKGQNDKGFLTQSGRTITRAEFAYHLSTILAGVYSLEGLEDKALIEALIHPDPVFHEVAYQGVPDERIVVYRGVPVMAMVRLPTRASDGKANLHKGAIGVGIQLDNGLTLSGVHHTDLITRHPDTGHPLNNIQIPYWEKILLMSARVTEMTGLNYIGADFVLDLDLGPVLLELNARPGLAIQLANQSGLRGRLEKIDQAPREIFQTAETRVAWAREAFGK